MLLLEGCTTMITIPLSTEDLTKGRLAPSPLWETVSSFEVLLHHDRHTVHAPWATRARPKLNLAMEGLANRSMLLDFPPKDR